MARTQALRPIVIAIAIAIAIVIAPSIAIGIGLRYLSLPPRRCKRSLWLHLTAMRRTRSKTQAYRDSVTLEVASDRSSRRQTSPSPRKAASTSASTPTPTPTPTPSASTRPRRRGRLQYEPEQEEESRVVRPVKKEGVDEQKNEKAEQKKHGQQAPAHVKSEPANADMTEYERKRLENIQRNLEFMRSMGVSTAKIAARTAVSGSGRSPAPPVKRKLKVKEHVPMRKSRRLEGKLADGLMLEDDKTVVVQPSASHGRSYDDPVGRLASNLEAHALNLGDDGGRHWLAQLADKDTEPAVDATGVDDLVDYELRAQDVVKATQERIYSVAFHPRTDRVVIACGDKRGNLSLWSADEDGNGDGGEDSAVAMYRPHTLPVTQLLFDPTDASRLLSSSFDGSVREFDLRAATFTERFVAMDDAGITSLSHGSGASRSFLVSQDDGQVARIDWRQPPTKSTNFVLHEKKINTVHQHPTADFCFATASLDRTVCLWDIRQLGSKATTNHALLVLPHTRSVNCAYFAPNGEHLVTVGQDNYLRVYATADTSRRDTEPVMPSLRIPHNNQTGRWLTKLHAAWDPKRPTRYVMGGLQQPRCLQIFDATRRNPVQKLTSEFFGSVHSINAFHPTRDLIAGGNSSGRMCLWRARARR